MKAGVFIDRDLLFSEMGGEPAEKRNVVKPLPKDRFRVNTELRSALERVRVHPELMVFLTTHQPKLSQGTLSRWELDNIHRLLMRVFPIDDIFICAHEETDGCPCRKPKPGLLVEAAFKWHVDLDRSYVISEQWEDAMAAHNAGATSFLLNSSRIKNSRHDFIVDTLEEAVDRIYQLHPLGMLEFSAYTSG